MLTASDYMIRDKQSAVIDVCWRDAVTPRLCAYVAAYAERVYDDDVITLLYVATRRYYAICDALFVAIMKRE